MFNISYDFSVVYYISELMSSYICGRKRNRTRIARMTRIRTDFPASSYAQNGYREIRSLSKKKLNILQLR
jgi:hypothetical protein